MEPQIQYAKTSDGVDIAFASMGEGPPVVRLGIPGLTHVQRELEITPGILPPLTKDFRVIWYDTRATGLSDRDAIDFSMEAMIRDLEAVIERTGLRSFAVLAFFNAVPIGVTYAARFPERVLAGKEFLFNDRGETELRGFEDPVRVYEVRWREGD